MIRLIVTLFENTHKNSIKNWFLPTIEVLKYDANRREKEQQFVYYTTYNEEKDDFLLLLIMLTYCRLEHFTAIISEAIR